MRIEHLKETGDMVVVSPFHFMSIAENEHKVSVITIAMIHRIVRDLHKDDIKNTTTSVYNREMHVSINFGQHDWYDDTTLNILVDACKQYNISHDRISIEILETSQFLRSSDKERIQKVKNLGFHLSVDDYGTKEGNMHKITYVRP